MARLNRVVRYGAVALVAAWSLLAVASYAALEMAAGWLGGVAAADGWIAWGGQTIGQVGAPIVAMVWLVGTLAIVGIMALLRRLVA
jgi:hypothetical protein